MALNPAISDTFRSISVTHYDTTSLSDAETATSTQTDGNIYIKSGIGIALTTTTDSANAVGSITGTILTVTEVLSGTLSVDQFLSGPGILSGTKIVQLNTGAGGVGDYIVNKSQNNGSVTFTARKDIINITNTGDGTGAYTEITDVNANSLYYPIFSRPPVSTSYEEGGDININDDPPSLQLDTVYIDRTETPLTYNPATGLLTSIGFSGSLYGAASDLQGGNSTTLYGSIPYQNDLDSTIFLTPNTSTTRKFLSETGDGTNGADPAWVTVESNELTGTILASNVVTSSLTSVGTLINLLVGPSANFTRFPNALTAISSTASGIQQNESGPIGLIAEATSSATEQAAGLYGVGYSTSTVAARGVVGEAHPSLATNGASAIGVQAYSQSPHSGGMNIGLYSYAANGASNYALYMTSGDIRSVATQKWLIRDNDAAALSIDSAGKTGILTVVTTDAAEGITMSGTLSVTGHVTVEGVTSTGSTGTGKFVFDTAPSILGGSYTSITSFSLRDTSAAFDVSVAATSSPALTANRALTFDLVNNDRTVRLAGNVSLGGNFTTTPSNAITFTTTGITGVTLPVTGTLATLAGAESLTNKKLGSLTTNGIVTTSNSDGTLSVTLTTGSDNVVLSTNPVISGGSHTSITSFSLRDTSAAFDVYVAATSSVALTANRTVTVDVINAARSIKLAGNIDIGGNFTTTPNNAVTFTTTGTTGVTLPTTGTLYGTALDSITSLQLATSLSDETGTGAVVFGTNPTISGGAHTSITSFSLRDTSAAFDVYVAATSSVALTANRTITVDVINSARSIKLAGNIDIGGNFTTTPSNAITFTTTGTTGVTLPVTGTLATLAGAESLTNKKLGSLTANGFVTTSNSDGTLGVSATSGTGDVVLNTNPVISGGSHTGMTSLGIRDSAAAFDLTIASTSSPLLTAGRTLTFDVSNANRSINLEGDVSLGGNFTTTSGNAVTFTTTGTTGVTLPVTGTLATLAGAESLTNKKLGSLTTNGIVTTSNSDGTLSVTLTTGSDNVVLSTTPTISGGSHTSITSFSLRDTSAAFDVYVAATSSVALTAHRTLTLDLINAGRTVKLAGNVDLGGNFTTTPNNSITFTTTGITSVTLPTTGTLATEEKSYFIVGTTSSTLGRASATQALTGISSVTGTTTLELKSTTNGAITLDSGSTGDVNIATGADVKAVTIGNTSVASSVTINNDTTFNSNIIIGNATSPSTKYIMWGDNSGWTLRYMTNAAGVPTERFRFTDTGNFSSVGTISSAVGFKYNNTAATVGSYLRGDGTNFIPGTIADNDLPTTLANKTLTLPKIKDTSGDHTYNFAVSELTANRSVTLPLLISDDTFVFENHEQTLTNKTLTSPVITDGTMGGAVTLASDLNFDADTLVIDATNDSVLIGTTTAIGRLTINSEQVDGVLDFTKGIIFGSNEGTGTPWSHAGITTVGSAGYKGALVFATDGGTTTVTQLVEALRLNPDQTGEAPQDWIIHGLTIGRGKNAVAGNTAIGASALAANQSSGTNNTAIGSSALLINTTGTNNTAVGVNTLTSNLIGSNNTAVGLNSLSTATGSFNVGLGAASLQSSTSGNNNVALGSSALLNNLTASNNVAVGYQAGYTNVDGDNNTFVGYKAGYLADPASATPSTNTFIGYNSGADVTTGTKNVIIGSYDGNTPTLNISTLSNHVVLSDGDGNIRQYFDNLGNATILGSLTVIGTTTTINSTTVTIDDPIFTLGGDTAPASDDNKDRGIEFRYHDGSSAKVGFFGYDDSVGKFTLITNATNTAEVFSGTLGGAVFGQTEISDNSPGAALRVTQTGTGNAITVEDSANPDSTPFVVDASGKVGVGTGTPSVAVHINTTDSILIPVGNTSQRPTGANGMLRYNSERGVFEGYAAGAWESIGAIATTSTAPTDPSEGDLWWNSSVNSLSVYHNALWYDAMPYSSPVRQSFIATAGQTTFAIAGGYTPNYVDVFLNGAKLLNGTDVTVTSGTNVVLTVGATLGSVVDVVGLKLTGLLDVLPVTGGTISGALNVQGLFTVSSGQIAFPAVQNPSSDPNTLDDYEENDWTPVLSFGGATTGITYTTQVGKYTKVGRMIFASAHVVLSSKGSATGAVEISGLPVTIGAGHVAGVSFGDINNMSGLTGTLIGKVSSSTIVVKQPSATGSTAITDTNCTNTTEWQISFTYAV